MNTMFQLFKGIPPFKYLTLSCCLLVPQVIFAQNIFPTSGSAGIGTNTPVGKFQIATLAADSVSSIRIGKDGDPGTLTVPVGQSTGGYNIDFHTWRDIIPNQIGARIRAERMNVYNPNSALIQGMDLAFHTSPGSVATQLAERMRINYLGNVGIGIANPSARLHVAAPWGTVQARFTQLDNSGGDGALSIFNSNGIDNTYIPTILGRTYCPGRAYGLYIAGESEDVVPNATDAIVGTIMMVARSKNASQYQLANNNVLAVNNATQNLFMIKANGNVGIGTTDPKGYKLAVNGAGVFTRVVVKTYSNWPDYVFAADYSLPSLSLLEQFITINKHLPEIPSAQVVAEEGQDVGEMNRLLLKKVEELTLYIIQLNKRLDAQQEVISTLQR